MTRRRSWIRSSACLLALLSIGQAHAQRERHDLMAYEAPPGWQKDEGTGYVKYTRIDGGSWAQIAVYAHARGVENVAADFDREWQSLVVDAFDVRQPPDKGQPAMAEGWSVLSGSGTWQSNGSNVATLLTTYSGHGVRMSILCNATARAYLQDCQRLIASAAPQAPAHQNPSLRAAAAPAGAAATAHGLDGDYTCLMLGFIRDLYSGVVSPHWEEKANPPRITLSGQRYSAPHGSGTIARRGDALSFIGGPIDGHQASIDRNDAGLFVLFRGDNPRVAKAGSVGYGDTHCQRSR